MALNIDTSNLSSFQDKGVMINWDSFNKIVTTVGTTAAMVSTAAAALKPAKVTETTTTLAPNSGGSSSGNGGGFLPFILLGLGLVLLKR
jgi:hypothetical protein